MQSSKVPTCTYKFQTARGPTLKSLNKSQKPKARSSLTNNANQALSHAEKKQYLWTIAQYANADEMQVILMKLWNLSHQCQDQLEKSKNLENGKHQGSTNGTKTLLQNEPQKLISVEVLHQITASFSVALLLLLNCRDLLCSQIKGFTDYIDS